MCRSPSAKPFEKDLTENFNTSFGQKDHPHKNYVNIKIKISSKNIALCEKMCYNVTNRKNADNRVGKCA